MRSAILPLLVLFSASVASAQAEDDGRDEYARGVELARDHGRCADAVPLFQRAIALRATPQRVLSLAVCLSTTDQHVEAANAFLRYLAMEGVDPESARAARGALDAELAAVGLLALRVVPADAEVTIDGAPHGGSGAERRIALTPGAHTIAVSAPGYAAHSEELVLRAGAERALDVTLRGDAVLVVRSSDAAAEIAIDGEPLGDGEVTATLSPGRHRVEVRSPGHDVFRETLDLQPGERRELDAALTPASSDGSLVESPVLWTIVGVLVVGAGVGIGVGVWAAGQDPQFSGETFTALTVRVD